MKHTLKVLVGMIKKKDEYDTPVVSINNSRSSVYHKFGSCIKRKNYYGSSIISNAV
jgi:hypothetical protein